MEAGHRAGACPTGGNWNRETVPPTIRTLYAKSAEVRA